MAQLVVHDLQTQHVALVEEHLAKPLPKNVVATPTSAAVQPTTPLMKALLLLLSLSGSALLGQAPATSPTGPLVVAADGSGQFRAVQAAIDAAPNQSEKPVIIQLKPGTYHEKVLVPTLKTHLVLHGVGDAAGTVITYSDHVGMPGITAPTSYSVLVQATDFTAGNVTFENAAGHTAGQAVALNGEGDRAIFRHCRMAGITRKTRRMRKPLITPSTRLPAPAPTPPPACPGATSSRLKRRKCTP